MKKVHCSQGFDHDKPGQGRLQHFAWLCRHERELLARALSEQVRQVHG